MTRLATILIIVQLIASAFIFAVTISYSLCALIAGAPITFLLFLGLALTVGRFLYMPSIRALVKKNHHRQLP